MSGAAGYSAGIESIPLPPGFKPENFIRISFSPTTSRKQTDMLADELITVSKQLRSYRGGNQI
jgi:cysteine sulfinate desulfinase/cysteine desulfurase-like protein